MKSTGIPNVVFKQDAEETKEKFISFFYKAPVFTQEIVRIHPSLAGVESKSREEGEKILDQYVHSYLEQNREKIDRFIATIETDFQRTGVKALASLTSIMQFTWPETIKEFTVYPGIRGGTNFNSLNNSLFLSIFTPTDQEKERALSGMTSTAIIIHEICHMIFRNIVTRESISVGGPDVMHIAQEVLAPVVMNQPEIADTLKLVGYLGNLYLKPIAFQTGEGSVNLIEFSENLYKDMISHGSTFCEYLIQLITELNSVQTDLEEKMKIWNTYGKKIFNDPEIRAKYEKPIIQTV